jgi:hypothetical protein
MKISPKQLAPSQDFLKPRTVAFIFECIQNDKLDQLPPAPIVRQGTDGTLIAIDGHNLIAVKLYRNEEIEVHLATSPDDGLPSTTEANRQRDEDLKEKFDLVLAERERLQLSGINTFNDLIDKYKDLFQG